jgi:biofilm PGA synthesis N-glycosyltransferase PgaC
MVAFRKVIDAIPVDSAVDEASIESLIILNGYKLHYAGDAVVYNKGSETVEDFVKQRRRCYAGHCYLRSRYKYTVSSMNFFLTFSLFLKTMKNFIRNFFWIWGAMFLEGYARVVGYYDYYVRHKNPYIWDVSESTKDLGEHDIDNL